MKKWHVVSIAIGLQTAVLLGSGEAILLSYKNDFGTETQFNSLTWEFKHSITLLNALDLRDDIGPQNPGDLDGDQLYGAVRCKTSAISDATGTKCIYAPCFMVLSKPTVSGYGAGHSSHASYAGWGLSLVEPERLYLKDFDHAVQTDSSNSWKLYATAGAAHSDPRYQRIFKFYATTIVRYYSGGTYNQGVAGRTAAFQVEALATRAVTGERTVIFNNDMGAAEQINEWTLDNGITFVWRPEFSTDLDAAANSITYPSGAGSKYATVHIEAPEGRFFRFPKATARGYGNKESLANFVTIGLSRDGVNWDIVSEVPVQGTSWYDLVADSSDSEAYDRPLTEVWFRVQLAAHAGAASARPQAGKFLVTAEMTVPLGTTLLVK